MNSDFLEIGWERARGEQSRVLASSKQQATEHVDVAIEVAKGRLLSALRAFSKVFRCAMTPQSHAILAAQPSNATKRTLKDLVEKHGSHATYATVNVDPAHAITEENMDKLAEEIGDEVDKAL